MYTGHLNRISSIFFYYYWILTTSNNKNIKYKRAIKYKTKISVLHLNLCVIQTFKKIGMIDGTFNVRLLLATIYVNNNLIIDNNLTTQFYFA